MAVRLAGWIFLIGLSLQAGTYVQFRTVLGDIEVDLMDQDKPATVNNFIRYLTNGYYQNVFFHRCLPGFVVQGGEFISLTQTSGNLLVPENTFAFPDFPAVTNEFAVGPRVSNTYGTIAMARAAGQTNSATSQWFFNLADNAGLDNVDGGFTVFGRVVRGTNVLEIFNALDLNRGIIDMRNWYPSTSYGELFKTLPVLFLGLDYPRLNDLIYVDITMLRVQVQQGTAGERIIRWRSVLNRTNRVEYTDIMPPQWKILASTNGTGQTAQITDVATGVPFRFYRVRVDF